MSIITFEVPGNPQGKGRARVGRVGNHAQVFADPKTVAYESLIALAYRHAMVEPEPPREGPVSLSVFIFCTIPASWAKKRQAAAINAPAPCKPDADNVIKAVCDGLNGQAWRDDKQVTAITSSKIYSTLPRLVVTIED
jgi:Holliday junction resolvase RusA-like endonuclease